MAVATQRGISGHPFHRTSSNSSASSGYRRLMASDPKSKSDQLEHDGPVQSPRPRALSDPPPSSEQKSARIDRYGNQNQFELEPNPFEQSFSIPDSVTRSTAREAQHPDLRTQRRARSQSPSGVRTPGGSSKLPPISSLGSPHINANVPTSDASFSAWGFDHGSLRTGPLSPAMLHGPSPGGVGFSTFSNLFDPSSFRTGLTPSASAATSAGIYAPPSPSTAALFAMMTNQEVTPSTTSQQPDQAKEKDSPNHFDLGFGKALESKGPAASGTSATATASSILPPLMGNQGYAAQPAKPMSYSNHVHNHNTALKQPSNLSYAPITYPNANQPDVVHPAALNGYAPAPVNGPSNGGVGHNPLYLLSQSAQELANDDTHLAADVLSNLNAHSPYSGSTSQPRPSSALPTVPPAAIIPMSASAVNNYAPMSSTTAVGNRSQSQTLSESPVSTNGASQSPKQVTRVTTTATGRKRKQTVYEEDLPNPAPAQRGRKKGSGKKQKMEEEEDVENGDGTGMPETEEEKRKNFLERNRQAALKCRQRKKAWLASLQSKVEYLTADNETLQSTVQALHDEVATLRSVLVAHKDCPIAVANGLNAHGIQTIGTYLQQTPHLTDRGGHIQPHNLAAPASSVQLPATTGFRQFSKS